MHVQTNVSYNKSARKWIARRGETTVEFPSGKMGKRSALELKLRADAPELWPILTRLLNLHRSNSAIVDRAWKAALLAAEQYVLRGSGSADDEIARVASRSQSISYVIQHQDSGGYCCNCPDWENGQLQKTMTKEDPERPTYGAPTINGHLYCKHILAYVLALNAGIELRDYPPNTQEMADQVWQSVCERLNLVNSPEQEDSLKHVRGVRFGRGELIVRAPSKAIADWLHSQILDQAEEVANEMLTEKTRIKIKTLEEYDVKD